MLETVEEIQEILNQINEMPYGKNYANRHSLPANPYHYGRYVDKLINVLIDFRSNGGDVSLCKIDELRSIRDNDVNKLITDYNSLKNKSLDIINYDMEKVSVRINCIVECILKS